MNDEDIERSRDASSRSTPDRLPSRAIRLTGHGPELAAHPMRDRIAGELHARPFTLIETPRRIYHLAYLTDAEAARADRAALAAFCRSHGTPAPDEEAKHHLVAIGQYRLRWEVHTEFTTYSWEAAQDALPPFSRPLLAEAPLKDMPPQPGPLLAAVHLALVSAADAPSYHAIFDRANLCIAKLHDDIAEAVTNFAPDAHGYSRVLVVDKGMRPERAGGVVQRLLEIETYRMLALLGLPEVERIRPQIARIEDELARLSQAPRDGSLDSNREQLSRLVRLATEVEALVAASDYRFGATRAYDAIVDQRLQSIREQSLEGYPRWSTFLARRMKPAIATCETTRERLQSLSGKLVGALDLLRTQIDIDIEQQNRDLLSSMDRRARLQLRLQQTVEGLSVAAVSYYVVGLLGYMLKGADEAVLPVSADVATALTVPLVVAAVWWTVRRIRRAHAGRDERKGTGRRH